MKNYWKKLIIIAGILLSTQLLAYLFMDISSTTLIFSIVISALYLVKTGDVQVGEAAAGAAGFVTSSFVFSAFGKVFFLDRMCEVSRSAAEVGSAPQVLNPDNICQGFIEAWIRALTTNPIYNWHFWLGTLAVTVLSGYAYRRYSR
jgi:hypothetical protein